MAVKEAAAAGAMREVREEAAVAGVREVRGKRRRFKTRGEGRDLSLEKDRATVQSHGKAAQLDPVKPTLKSPETKRLKP